MPACVSKAPVHGAALASAALAISESGKGRPMEEERAEEQTAVELRSASPVRPQTSRSFPLPW